MVLHNAMLGCPQRLAEFAEKEACAAVLGCLLRETYAKQHAPMSEDAVDMRERVGAWTECVAGQLLGGGHLMRVHQRLSTDPGLRKAGEQPMELLFWYRESWHVSDTINRCQDTRQAPQRSESLVVMLSLASQLLKT